MRTLNSIELLRVWEDGIHFTLTERSLQLLSIACSVPDLNQVAEIWRYGSVVQSWLLDLAAAALAENPRLEGIAPYVADSGEGRWTATEALDLNVAAPVITLALLQRLQSRDSESFSDKLLAALRNQFGGHEMKKE